MSSSVDVGPLIRAVTAEIYIELGQDPAAILDVRQSPTLELRGFVAMDADTALWMPFPVDAARLAKGEEEDMARQFVSDLKTARNSLPNGLTAVS